MSYRIKEYRTLAPEVIQEIQQKFEEERIPVGRLSRMYQLAWMQVYEITHGKTKKDEHTLRMGHHRQLTWPAVDDIRARSAAGESVKDIADEYDVSKVTIQLVLNNKRWMVEDHP